MSDLERFVTSIKTRFSPRIIESWLHEFGYAFRPGFDTYMTLLGVAAERGPRLERELDLHGKRLAERARMSSAPVGRAAVIR